MPDDQEQPFTLQRITAGPRVLLQVLFRGRPVGWTQDAGEIDKLNATYQAAMRRRLNGHDRPGD